MSQILQVGEGNRLKYMTLALLSLSRGKLSVFIPGASKKVEFGVFYQNGKFFLTSTSGEKEEVVFVSHQGGYTRSMIRS